MALVIIHYDTEIRPKAVRLTWASVLKHRIGLLFHRQYILSSLCLMRSLNIYTDQSMTPVSSAQLG